MPQLINLMSTVGDPPPSDPAALEPGALMLVADDPLAPKIVALWGQRELSNPEAVLEDDVALEEVARLTGCPHINDVAASIERCCVAGVIAEEGPTELGILWVRALARRELGGRRKPKKPVGAS